MGKTTLAVELARWLAATNRVARVAFASVEGVSDPRGILDALGRQLVPDYTVAQYPDLKTALQPIERALRNATTLIVIDNLESILDFGLPIADVGLSGDEESKIGNLVFMPGALTRCPGHPPALYQPRGVAGAF